MAQPSNKKPKTASGKLAKTSGAKGNTRGIKGSKELPPQQPDQKKSVRKNLTKGSKGKEASGALTKAAPSKPKGVSKPVSKPKPSPKQRAKRVTSHTQASPNPARKPGKDFEALLRAGLQFCPHAQACGACQTINDSYEESLQAKDDYVAELFEDLMSEEVLEPTLGMDVPLHYRNKVISPFVYGKQKTAQASNDFIAKKQAKGGHGRQDGRHTKSAPKREILCGMYASGTHHVVDTTYCLVENEQAKAVFQTIRALMEKWSIEPYDEDTGKGFLRHAVVRVGHKSDEVLVTLVANDDAFPNSKSFCRELVKRCPFITTIVQNVNTRQTNVVLGDKERTLYGPGFILDELCGLSFRISSQSFYQVNATQTEVLYNVAMDFAQVADAQTVIDAYCGTGTIGLVAASRGADQVIGVDNVASAIEDARQNARHNGLTNATFVHADATEFMKTQAAEGTSIDVLLMDPPRAGSTPEFLDAALQLQPKRIVYISCNPQTQARDAAHLCRGGYRLTRLQPVDMFPHTEHVETVALFER